MNTHNDNVDGDAIFTKDINNCDKKKPAPSRKMQ